MLFNSLDYFYLLFFTVPVYWIACRNTCTRNFVLLFSSAYFYISWSALYYIMLLGIIAVVWLASRRLEGEGARWVLTGSIVGLLGCLAYFKYANFFLENIISLAVEDKKTFDGLQIILPLAISFYIFQLIAYLVDIYRKKTKPELKFFDFAVFISFFPQLIAGPICRSYQLLPQLKEMRTWRWDYLYDGVILIVCGLCLKVVFADGIGPYVDVVFATPANYSSADNILATFGFGVQILCDFWGYSLIAVGSGKLFGISLPYNFNLPYIATSIQDFWHRWHLTLSSWLKDYLYISLGGNRKGTLITYRNLFLTMLLGGFWHGASWNFLIWGLIHGLALISDRAVSVLSRSTAVSVKFVKNIAGWFITMLIVFLAWIFFRAQTIDDSLKIIGHIFEANFQTISIPNEYFEYLLLFIPVHFVIHKLTFEGSLENFGRRYAPLLVPVISLITVIYFTEGSEFIYFQF